MDITTAKYRIRVGTFIVAWAIIMSTLDAVMENVTLNSAIAMAAFTAGITLIGAGLVKKSNYQQEQPYNAI